jgi:hypothetical protein
MLSDRKVMSTACMSTSGSEAIGDDRFTIFIVPPQEGCVQCTEGNFVVE